MDGRDCYKIYLHESINNTGKYIFEISNLIECIGGEGCIRNDNSLLHGIDYASSIYNDGCLEESILFTGLDKYFEEY